MFYVSIPRNGGGGFFFIQIWKNATSNKHINKHAGTSLISALCKCLKRGVTKHDTESKCSIPDDRPFPARCVFTLCISECVNAEGEHLGHDLSGIYRCGIPLHLSGEVSPEERPRTAERPLRRPGSLLHAEETVVSVPLPLSPAPSQEPCNLVG